MLLLFKSITKKTKLYDAVGFIYTKISGKTNIINSLAPRSPMVKVALPMCLRWFMFKLVFACELII